MHKLKKPLIMHKQIPAKSADCEAGTKVNEAEAYEAEKIRNKQIKKQISKKQISKKK